MGLKLNRQDVAKYCSEHQYSMLMINDATYDYIAARCCIINYLFPGYILACQAIEKMLKGIYYVVTKIKPPNIHNLYDLKEELKNYQDFHLDSYDHLLKELFGHYQSRYFDNPNGVTSKEISQEKVDEIDEIWFHLIEILPFPDEVKYRSGTYSILCGRKSNKSNKDREWIVKYNNLLKKRIEIIEKRHNEVYNHLYST